MAKKFSLESMLTLTDGITAPFKAIEKAGTSFSKSMKKNFGGFGKDVQSANKVIDSTFKNLAIGGAAAATGVVLLGKSFLDAGAEVEKYKTTLKTMLGSQELANQRFEEMSQFAASTPFELNEVVTLGNQLQALGKYSKENMTILGDLAAASGKPIDQVTGAFAKLVSGQKGEAVNMFRDLLISTADWSAATGKGIKKNGEMVATTEEMIAALPKILGAKGFTGMMDNLSRTNEGITSNFKDTITRFKQGVGGILLPAWNKVLLALTKVVSKFSEVFSEKGSKYVDKIAGGIGRLADWILEIDVKKVIEQFMSFMRTVKGVIDFLAPLAPMILALVVAVKVITFAMAAYNAVMWLVSLNPITLTIIAIIAGIAALTLAITWLVKNWDLVIKGFQWVKDNALGIVMALGQSLLKFWLTPINLVVDAVQGLLGLMRNIPGVGKIADGISKGIEGVQGGINKALTGSAGVFDYAGSARSAFATYGSPTTRGAESRSYSESRITNEVIVSADRGASVREPGRAPTRSLSYGRAQ